MSAALANGRPDSDATTWQAFMLGWAAAAMLRTHAWRLVLLVLAQSAFEAEALGAWQLVAILKGATVPSSGATGDVNSCSDNNLSLIPL